MNKAKRFSVTILLLMGFLVSVFCLAIRFSGYRSGRMEYRLLQGQFRSYAEEDGSLTNNAAEGRWDKEEADEWTRLMVSRNPDYIFWLSIPGTHINYPVVKNVIPGYYLNHTFSGKKNPCGSIFCGEEGENLIIYGHNMKDGSMFADLKLYINEDFFREHRSIWLYRRGDWQQYTIVSCQIVDEDETGIYQSHFYSREEKQRYLNKIESKSLYPTGKQLEMTDHLLTLSTCLGKGKRVIVQAVLLCYTE